MIHTVKGFSIVNKAEVDGFLEFPCFSNDPLVVGNLMSGSSAFFKSSLNIWKFSVHVPLKPNLEKSALVFFRIGRKLSISSLVATSEFSKFAGVLRAALSQHHHFFNLK